MDGSGRGIRIVMSRIRRAQVAWIGPWVSFVVGPVPRDGGPTNLSGMATGIAETPFSIADPFLAERR